MESLFFRFGFLIQGTPLAESALRAEEIPLRGRCLACGQEFSMDGWLGECPSCREVQIEIISGKELDVVGVEGE